MKWDVHVYDPRTQSTSTRVMDYPGTHRSDGAAVTAYASKDLHKHMRHILAVPHRGDPPEPSGGPARRAGRAGRVKSFAQLEQEISEAVEGPDRRADIARRERRGDVRHLLYRGEPTTDATWFRFATPGKPAVVGVVQGSGGVLRHGKEEATRRLRRQARLAKKGAPLDVYEPRRGHVRVFPNYGSDGSGSHVDVDLRRATFRVVAIPGERRPI